MRACAQRDLELGIQLDQLRLRTKDAAGPALHHNARPTAARAAIARPNDADHTPAGLSTEGTLSAPGAIAQLGCRTGSEPLLKEAVRTGAIAQPCSRTTTEPLFEVIVRLPSGHCAPDLTSRVSKAC